MPVYMCVPVSQNCLVYAELYITVMLSQPHLPKNCIMEFPSLLRINRAIVDVLCHVLAGHAHRVCA